MASEMRRLARALVEQRSETFSSRHGMDESMARLEAALGATAPKAVIAQMRWKDEDGRAMLEARFLPARGTQRFLAASSSGLVLLLVASAWALISPDHDRSLAFLVLLVTVLVILGFPILVVALGSRREAEEARIRRAIRHALLDEPELPPPLGDED